MPVALIVIISLTCLSVAAGAVLWYAFRFEVTNFKLSSSIIYLKPHPGETSIYSKGGYPETGISSAGNNNIIAPDIKNPADSLKILHLSDFHLRTDYKGEKLVGFMKNISLEEYDFILITGDMVEKNELQDELVKMLGTLKARYGIYAVFGAHDYYNKKPIEFIKNMFSKQESYSRKNDSAGLRKKLEAIGINVLQNENKTLEHINGFAEISIIGVDDPLINKMDLQKALRGVLNSRESTRILKVSNKNASAGSRDTGLPPATDTPIGRNEVKNMKNSYLAATEGVLKTREYKEEFSPDTRKYHELKEKGKLKIALIHTPDSYALVSLALNGIDIVFSGHTHGGQVRAPFAGALISGCNLKTRYASGLFYFRNFVLQVSRGLGEGRFSRFRINCDPEAIITEIIRN